MSAILRTLFSVAGLAFQIAALVASGAEDWHRAFFLATTACGCWAAVALLYSYTVMAIARALRPLLDTPPTAGPSRG